jgi:hypothetical protein
MRRFLLSILLGGLALSATAQNPLDPTFSAIDKDFALPAQAHKMFPQDWDVYAGRYFLSNGQTMVLRRAGLRMFASIAGGPPQPLVALSGNEFVATDQRLKMTLVDEGLGRFTGQVAMVVPRQMAQQSEPLQGGVVRVAIE